eukprot:1159770-Pelagomonas_calceolata.AAC.12
MNAARAAQQNYGGWYPLWTEGSKQNKCWIRELYQWSVHSAATAAGTQAAYAPPYLQQSHWHTLLLAFCTAQVKGHTCSAPNSSKSVVLAPPCRQGNVFPWRSTGTTVQARQGSPLAVNRHHRAGRATFSLGCQQAPPCRQGKPTNVTMQAGQGSVSLGCQQAVCNSARLLAPKQMQCSHNHWNQNHWKQPAGPALVHSPPVVNLPPSQNVSLLKQVLRDHLVLHIHHLRSHQGQLKSVCLMTKAAA